MRMGLLGAAGAALAATAGAREIGWEEVRDRLVARGAGDRLAVEQVSLRREGDGIAMRFRDLEGEAREIWMETDRHLFAADFTHHVVSAGGRRRLHVEDTDCVFRTPAPAKDGVLAHANLCGETLTASVRLPGSTARLRLMGTEPFGGATPQWRGDGNLTALIYDTSVRIDDEWTCGGEHHHDNDDGESTERQLLREVIAQEKSDARELVGSQTKYIKMLIVNDHARFLEHGPRTQSNSASVLQGVQDLMDLFNEKSFYQLRIQVVAMITLAHGDPWDAAPSDSNGEMDQATLLTRFSTWRTQLYIADLVPAHGLAHLLSGHAFQGSVVGLARVRALCSDTGGTGVVQATGLTLDTIATVTAHELMHGLGARHNGDIAPGSLVSSPCAKSGGNIMDPAGVTEDSWTDCTVNWVKMSFEGIPYPRGCSGNACTFRPTYGLRFQQCAENGAEAEWTLAPTCGNGIREKGEACDCGNADCSDVDPCCDGNTCQLKPGAACSSTDPCCQDTCEVVPRSAKHVCRPAVDHQCDKREVCNGVDATCPVDQHEPIGTLCEDDGACFAGVCQSQAEQCRLRDLDPCEELSQDCGALLCKLKGATRDGCTKIGDSDGSGYIQVEDGTPCKQDNPFAAAINRTLCSAGSCVASTELRVPVTIACTNGQLDSGETDVDCGGPHCPACNPSETCLEDRDCFGTVDQPGRCDRIGRGGDGAGDAPEPEANLPPIGSTCNSFNGEQQECQRYAACIWLDKFSRCEVTGDFPPEADSESCSATNPSESCCISERSEVTCARWRLCMWDHFDEGPLCVPTGQQNSGGRDGGGGSAEPGSCRVYTSAPTPSSKSGPGGSFGDGYFKPRDVHGRNPFLGLWEDLDEHMPLFAGSLAGVLLLSLMASVYICKRNCRKPDPNSAPINLEAHRYRLRKAPRRLSAQISRSSTLGVPTAATVQEPGAPVLPETQSARSPPRAPSASGSFSVRPCPACLVHFANPQNPLSLCNSVFGPDPVNSADSVGAVVWAIACDRNSAAIGAIGAANCDCAAFGAANCDCAAGPKLRIRRVCAARRGPRDTISSDGGQNTANSRQVADNAGSQVASDSG